MSEFSGILSPTMEVKNKKGEVVLALKKKGEKYGQLYYLFELHWDRIEPENLAKFNMAWTLTKMLARNMGIPLFDYNDVIKETEKQIQTISAGETKDITIKILNHATGEITNLVAAVTKHPA